MTEFAPLLKAARPTVYQTNGFRLIGIAVDANASEINRQLQKLELIQKFGTSGQQLSTGLLPVASPPSTSALQDAKQRLNDPGSRIVEELFWFWPEEPHASKSDLALQAIQRGDSQSATEIWLTRAKKPSDSSALHNLAVLFHVQALDSVNPGQDGNVPEAVWTRAWKYWRTLVEHDPFWHRLAARIEELDDPRLPPRASAQIRSSLRSAILQIDLSLAVNAAEAGNFARSSTHLKLARESGFVAEVVRQRTEHALVHVKTRIEHLCDETERKSTEQVEQTPQFLRKLLADSKPSLEILNYCVGAGSRLRDAAHDRVAQTIRENLVVYGNQTEDWKTCEQLLDLATPLATSESQRTRIADDLSTLKRVREATLCWFCKETAGNEKCGAVVDMYGEVRRTPTWNGTNFQWRNLPIKVPRCQQCLNIHRARKIVAGTATALIAAAMTWDSREPHIPAFFATISAWLGMLVAGHIGWFGRSRNGKRMAVLKEGAKREHPVIHQMKAQLWAFGKRPTDAPTEISGSAVGKFFAWLATFLALIWIFSLLGKSSAPVIQRTPPVQRYSPNAPNVRKPNLGANSSLDDELEGLKVSSKSTDTKTDTVRIGIQPDNWSQHKVKPSTENIFDRLEASQRDSLQREIQSNKARLAVLSTEFEACQDRLQRLRDEIALDRQQLEQMQTNSRLGVYVNEHEYETVRQGHNSNVRLYNAELPRCRAMAQEHDALVEATNSKIRDYNRIKGAR